MVRMSEWLTIHLTKQMNFSDEYVRKLSETTNVSPAEIRRMEDQLIKKVQEVLITARALESSGKLNKNVLSLVLKERLYQFI